MRRERSMKKDHAPSVKDYDFAIKIVLVGDSCVGKTSLLLKFTDESFIDSMISTIGVDFRSKKLDICGKNVKMQIWDTAGQEQYQSITRGYYRGSHGAIIVYDVTNRSSFEHVTKWLCQIEEIEPEMPKILVANKIDSTPQEVTTQDGTNLADQYLIPYLETSAKTGRSIEETFRTIGNLASNYFLKTSEEQKRDKMSPRPKEEAPSKNLRDLRSYIKHKKRSKRFCSLL